MKRGQMRINHAVVGVVMLFIFSFTTKEEVMANTVFTNAYMFYSTAGNFMCFIPGDDLQGEIYYATKAKKAVNSGILYTTLGWQVVMHDSYGYPIEVIYYQLGGNNMVLINSMEVDGYEYCLYKISLANIKERMSSESLSALNTANSFISFNACTTTKINGVAQGGMTDYGPAWGAVYTTYEGIANAQNWSAETKQTLYSYYNKPVYGLFYTVTIEAGEGISAVTGAGSYCYGATATISATPTNGYDFSHWEGDSYTTNQMHSFVITNANVSYKAVAKPAALQVNFYKGEEAQGNPSVIEKYECGKGGQTLPNYNWRKEGYHQVGWSSRRNASSPEYEMKQTIIDEWIRFHYPSTDLYAVWDINQYKVIFDSNDGEGFIPQIQGDYFSNVSLPKEGFSREMATLVGWSTKKDAVTSEYLCGEVVSLSDLVNSLQLQHKNNAVITLYAVWDLAPEILGGDIYISLEDAKKGVITDSWLSNYLRAEDKEDGTIFYGKHDNNSFLAIDYQGTDFTVFQKEGMITESFCAIDHVGNETRKRIKVYIVDTTIYDADRLRGSFRFISQKYYKDSIGNYVLEKDGGLWNESVWKTNVEYVQVLDKIFGKKE